MSNQHRSSSAAGGRQRVPRGTLLLTGLCFLLFVVYGSLVPLDYSPYPLEQAFAKFRDIRYLALGIESRADWVANILIYMPLGFFFAGALGGGAGTPQVLRFLAGVLVFAFCATLAVAIEFAQLFFPPRSVLLNDIVAEWIGTALGVVIWWAAGPRLLRLRGAMNFGGPLAIRAAMTLYVLGYLTLSLFPYDFLVSAEELRAKLGSSQFAALLAVESCGGLFKCAVKLSAEVAVAVPLGVLTGLVLSRGFRYPYALALVVGVLLGAAIEAGQLFLASGVSQGVSIATRGLGLVAGIAAQRIAAATGFDALRRWLRPAILLAAVPYLVLLTAVNGWYAARWSGIDAALKNLSEVRFLIFYYHYYTTETVALKSLLSVIAMYLPVGIALWAWQAGARSVRTASPMAAALVATVLAVVVETGRLFVPGHKPDPTDVLIAAVAAWLACAGAATAMRWATESVKDAPADAPPAQAADTAAGGSSVAARLLSLPFAGAALSMVVLHPYGAWLAAFLGIFALGTWFRPRAALPGLLALLPLVSCAPWTGWYFFDEYDALLLVTVAVLLWRIPPAHWNPRRAGVHRWIILPLLASYAISAAIGLAPWQPIDANSFASYYSHYNSLRILKGFLWALLLAGPFMQQWRLGAGGWRALSAGMLAGLAGVGIAALWERHLFTGLLNFSAEHRIAGTFADVHTGGSFVEAYLVLAMPFLAAWAYLRRDALALAPIGVLFVLASYALLVTFGRGGYLGYATALAVLGASALVCALRRRDGRGSPYRIVASLLLTAAVVAIPVFQGSTFKERWKAFGSDAAFRIAHWRTALAMMDDSPATMLFGMGLGRFPSTWFFGNASGVTPATFRIGTEGGNAFLKLGAGKDVYFGQRVGVGAERAYVVELDARSASPGGAVSLALCEKSLLFSHACRQVKVALEEPVGAWKHYRLELASGEIGKGPWHRRRPAEIAFLNDQSAAVVDVDNVRLTDIADGRELLRNGDFTRGHDHWFPSSDGHWWWHVHNLPVAIYFEQGVLGLVAAGTAVIFGLLRLALGVRRGYFLSGVLLAALAGFLVLGLTDSLFDGPRITLLFFLLLFAATARPPPSELRETG